jgi:Ca2+-binding EF-hand superfamily protein
MVMPILLSLGLTQFCSRIYVYIHISHQMLRIIKRCGMTLPEWFAFVDTSQAGRGDGKLTQMELRQGLERTAQLILKRENCCIHARCFRAPNYGYATVTSGGNGIAVTCSDHFIEGMSYLGSTNKKGLSLSKTIAASTTKSNSSSSNNTTAVTLSSSCKRNSNIPLVQEDPTFSRDEIRELLRYVDRDGNYDIELIEMLHASDALDGNDSTTAINSAAGQVLGRLQQHLRLSGGRLRDLFNETDTDKNGLISKDELRQLLIKAAADPLQKRVAVKRAADAQHALEHTRTQAMTAMSERICRLELAKKTGAYLVLKRLIAWQRKTNMRIVDAFR